MTDKAATAPDTKAPRKEPAPPQTPKSSQDETIRRVIGDPRQAVQLIARNVIGLG